MKLVTFRQANLFRLGAILDDRVLDLQRAFVSYIVENPEQGQWLSPGFPPDILSFLKGDSEYWNLAGEILTWAANLSSEQDLLRPLSQTQLAPVVPNPSKIICIALNYMDHCREQKVEVPKSPVLFAKFPSALIGSQDNITWPPAASQQVDYEAELAVVIGRTARNVPAERAYDYIAGYTISNDISARDVQFSDGQWVRGKSFDTFFPFGPFLATPDEVGDPGHLQILCRLNGRLVQDSNTDQLIFKIPELLEFITSTCTLFPGDVISTGTPNGVGVFRKPQIFLQQGDLIEVEIEKLGCLRNHVV